MGRRSGGGRSMGGSRSTFGSGSRSRSFSTRSATPKSTTSSRTTTTTRTATQPAHANVPAVQGHSPAATTPTYGSNAGFGAPGLGSMMMQGMAFGGGSAIAHRAVDSITGGPRIQVEHTGSSMDTTQQLQQQPSTMDAINPNNAAVVANNPNNTVCGEEVKSFLECMNENGQDISNCKFVFDMLSQCQQVAKDNARWASASS